MGLSVEFRQRGRREGVEEAGRARWTNGERQRERGRKGRARGGESRKEGVGRRFWWVELWWKDQIGDISNHYHVASVSSFRRGSSCVVAGG